MAFTRCTALLLACAMAAASAANVTARTSLGPVIGTAANGTRCASFKGIRYAAPPTGAARFMPPQPAAPWSSPAPALHVGRSCLQTFGDAFMSFPPALEWLLEKLDLGMEPMSEDCLFLNVWTPRVPAAAAGGAALLPVMVWFHGGSLMGGSGDLQSNYPFYDGATMCAPGAAGGDVVVVSVNYRLGVFGFLAHDALLAEGGTAGNMGLQDQRAALAWVRANAAAFGGDPARVTIFGESSGAASVATHLASERSSPLFAAAMMQSGGIWLQTYEQSRSQSAEVVRAVGCPTDSAAPSALQCLRALSAEKLLLTQDKAGWTLEQPCADGYEFARNVTERQVFGSSSSSSSSSSSYIAKPVLIGTNTNESALFDCGNASKHMSAADVRAKMAAALRVNFDPSAAELDELMLLYDAPTRYGGEWGTAYTDFDTDLQFTCDSRTILDATAAQGVPAYAYRLDHTPFFMEADACWGVPHMSDLFFLFGNFDSILARGGRELGARMRAFWKAFATDPSGPAGPGGGWPAYGGAAQREYLKLTVPTDGAGAQWKQAQCDVLDRIRAR